MLLSHTYPHQWMKISVIKYNQCANQNGKKKSVKEEIKALETENAGGKMEVRMSLAQLKEWSIKEKGRKIEYRNIYFKGTS